MIALDRLASPIPSDDAPTTADIDFMLLLTHTPCLSMTRRDIVLALRDGMTTHDLALAMCVHDDAMPMLTDTLRRVRNVLRAELTD